MDITFARGPEPTEMALLLLAVAATSAIVAALGIWLRRASTTAPRRVVAGLLFGLGIAGLVLFSFPLLYPHHHHDTEWVREQWRWNYRVDAAIGVGYWLIIAALSLAWRRTRHRPGLAV
jgi:hypothetical protein